MLYYLFEWLQKLNFPGAGMFGYTSFRALMAVILALLISSIWGDKFINLLKKETNHGDTTGCENRPVRRQQSRRTKHGRCHHHCSHPDPLSIVR